MDNKPANSGRLSDKVAIVTGGASGIGRGISLEFASQGAVVAIADINAQGAVKVADEIHELGGEAIALEVDICDYRKVTAAAAQALERFGRIDVLVNNAGWNKPLLPEEYTIDLWEKTLAINLEGGWYFCQAVIPHMMKKRSGKIINIGSGAGILGTPKAAPYIIAKHGVSGLTRALACDLGPYNINVNCICPGSVETPLLYEVLTPQNRQAILNQYPMPRLGKPSDIAKAALFLASADADWITGVILPVDGGLTCCIRARHYD